LLSNGVVFAQDFTEIRELIAEQLLYPRESRYSLRATLPSDLVNFSKNEEFVAVAKRLYKAGLISINKTSGRKVLRGTEQSLDIIIPSMNLRYETTALNVVLGIWDIEVKKVQKIGGITIVNGSRRLIKPTRAYNEVVPILPEKLVKHYTKEDMIWEINREGPSITVDERLNRSYNN